MRWIALVLAGLCVGCAGSAGGGNGGGVPSGFETQTLRAAVVNVAEADYDNLFTAAMDVLGPYRIAEEDRPGGRLVSGNFGISVGSFFDGKRTDIEAGIEWRASRYFFFGLEVEQNSIDLPGGDFVTRIGRARIGGRDHAVRCQRQNALGRQGPHVTDIRQFGCGGRVGAGGIDTHQVSFGPQGIDDLGE